MEEKFDLSYIKNRREALNISMQEMAEIFGFKNASTYLKYESGSYLFKAEMLPKLSVVLECDITNFFVQKIAEIEI
ncbi:helix-turn-helix transcriptional regulator [Listeria booriae]|uniref:Helix-turn-helix transcriptional regulator n=1 Tax=Listeria booriae TaxID=1552123 RepID=A0A841W9P3_9LIST|nr:helix-turn-helix transcriptional regulator [Listeria booriae]MBC1209515.1 helix-turn-helix transcriptional regulator [Listeria booriae]MBC1229762.1 helix-turn-helix transcriptional regulator [Listeria booriae]MBC1233111.1 helix-turn-helix transcriptional regulator [Listeria booriae]MBC2004402.1 helix-turn-helix transcriptional regulator [Listeria booriae]